MAKPHILQPTSQAFAIGATIAAVGITLIGIPTATINAPKTRRRQDPGHIVIDEATGRIIASIFTKPRWRHVTLALFLTRP